MSNLFFVLFKLTYLLKWIGLAAIPEGFLVLSYAWKS
jgi:hypothetical protein